MRGRLIRFLSAVANWARFSEEEVELMEADEEEGEESVEIVDEVEDLWRSMGEGFSSSLPLW